MVRTWLKAQKEVVWHTDHTQIHHTFLIVFVIRNHLTLLQPVRLFILLRIVYWWLIITILFTVYLQTYIMEEILFQ